VNAFLTIQILASCFGMQGQSVTLNQGTHVQHGMGDMQISLVGALGQMDM
jgi:hypothetical protein